MSNYLLFSKHRNKIMGVAVLSVFLCHLFNSFDLSYDSSFQLLKIPVFFVFTYGFLFMSGYFSYHSLIRDPETLYYYKRRIVSFYLPFLLVSAPFILYLSLYDKGIRGLLYVVPRLLSLSYWIEGNYYSLWFISVLMSCYIIIPLIHNTKYKEIICILVILLNVILIECAHYYNWSCSMGIYQMISFWIGYLFALTERKVIFLFEKTMSLLCLLIPFCFFINNHVFYRELILCLANTFIIALLFNIFRIPKIYKYLEALGMVSFELYLLHVLIMSVLIRILDIPMWVSVSCSIIISLIICRRINALICEMKQSNLFKDNNLLISLWNRIPYKYYLPSKEPIDVIIPIIEKDLSILPLALEGIKKCVTNIVKDIYIVAPKNVTIENFCVANSLVFVNESSLFGFSPSKIELFVDSGNQKIDRSGWLFQQLIKLSGQIGTCSYYLCIDADHILLQPHVFLDNNNIPIFYMSEEHHIPYYRNIEKLVGYGKKTSYFSYVAHKMLFSKQEIIKLHKQIHKNCGKYWIDAIIESYDNSQMSGFSEFELYGNSIKLKHLRPWKQISLKYDGLSDYQTLLNRWGNKYYSVTFPAYANE